MIYLECQAKSSATVSQDRSLHNTGDTPPSLKSLLKANSKYGQTACRHMLSGNVAQ